MAKMSKFDKNRQNSTENRSDGASQPICVDFCVPGRDSASILIDLARFRTLLGALFGVPGRPWAASRRSRDVPGTPRVAPKTPSGRSWALRGVPNGSRDRFCLDLGCPEITPGTDSGSIFASNFALVSSDPDLAPDPNLI